MKPTRIALLGIGLSAAILFTLAGNSAKAQGIYIGPGGISFGTPVGSYFLAFNNGGGYYPGRSSARAYPGRFYGRPGMFWAPGVAWSPVNYWYGDIGWTRFKSVITEPSTVDIPGFSPSQFNDRRDLPPMVQLGELERMTWSHMRRVLAFGASQLERELARVATGPKWDDYLQVKQLESMFVRQADMPPTSEETEELKALLVKFDQTAEADQYQAVSRLWGFEAVRRTLAAYLENPASRYRRQLAMNSNDLDRALERFTTGASWQRYFALPTEVFVNPNDAAAAQNPPDTEVLRAVLTKFDDVAMNPGYRMIARLPAFQATHYSLARYLGRDSSNVSPTAGYGQYPDATADPITGQEKVTPKPELPEPDSTLPAPEEPKSETEAAKPEETENAPQEPQPGLDASQDEPATVTEELTPPADGNSPKAGIAVREKE